MVIMSIDGWRADSVAGLDKAVNGYTDLHQSIPKSWQMQYPKQFTEENPRNSRLYQDDVLAATWTIDKSIQAYTGQYSGIEGRMEVVADTKKEIEQDNVLDHYKRQGKEGFALNADYLYHEKFGAYFTDEQRWIQDPSTEFFNLNIGDTQVYERYLEKMKPENQPDFLVMDFSGVDHAVHKYQVFSEEYKWKLGNMEEYLKNVIKNLPSNTTIFIFGDHGTGTWRHGRNAEPDRNTVLWIYNRDLTFFTDQTTDKIIGTQLAPILSVLGNTVTPYVNQGFIMPELALYPHEVPQSK